MGVAEESLWPEIRPSAPRSPVSILREQAQYLAETTRHHVVGKVVTHEDVAPFLLAHTLYLRVRALSNYSYALLVVHQKNAPYPVAVEHAGRKRICPNEERYVDALREVFSHADTVSLIRTLIDVANTPDDSGVQEDSGPPQRRREGF